MPVTLETLIPPPDRGECCSAQDIRGSVVRRLTVWVWTRHTLVGIFEAGADQHTVRRGQLVLNRERDNHSQLRGGRPDSVVDLLMVEEDIALDVDEHIGVSD